MKSGFKYIGGVLAVGGLLAAFSGFSQAGALSAGRDTPQRFNDYTELTVASNVIIYAGSLVCVNSIGLAAPAADSASFAVVGRAEATVDNRTAVYVATKTIKVARGVFRWANADNIVAADIGKIAYVTDDQTVNKTGGGQAIIAGSIIDVESAGVWVDTAKVGPIGAATPSSLTVSGNGSVGGTLAVTGASTLTGALTAKSTVNVASTLVVTGAVTQVATPVFAHVTAAAPTNAISQGMTITVNGTNYVVALYPN